MRIIIVGAGNAGTELIESLSFENHNVVVIDKKHDLVEELVNLYDVKGICGNGATKEVLEEANVKNADIIIACTHNDELNILCCLLAKNFGAKETIARVRNPEYFNLFNDDDTPLSMMINPADDVADEIFRSLRYQQAIKIDPFADGKIEMMELRVEEGSIWANKRLMDLPAVFDQKILVSAIERDSDIIIPDGKAVLLPDDKIYVIAPTKTISKLSRRLNFVKGAKKVMIIGGSDIAKYLAKNLARIDATVKIIERNRLRCISLDEELPHAEIIHGDGTDHKLVMDEGMAECDVVISLCSLDEQNIIISLFALSLGVKKVITKIDQPSYYNMLAESGLDSIVSLRKSTAEHIIKYVRSKQNVTGSKVNRLYNIVNSQAEAIEFIVSPTFTQLSVPLKDLKVIPNILIGAIVRNKELIIPGGMDTIEVGDTVIVVSKVREEPLDDLNDILA